MIEPADADIGRSVIYHDKNTGQSEEGFIKSFNEHYVFVHYIGRNVMATRREDLEWSFPP
jgi:hypothetical protein